MGGTLLWNCSQCPDFSRQLILNLLPQRSTPDVVESIEPLLQCGLGVHCSGFSLGSIWVWPHVQVMGVLGDMKPALSL